MQTTAVHSGIGPILLVILQTAFLVAIPVGVILIAIGLFRYFSGPGEDSPDAILQRRYAQGEISWSEYETLLEQLNLPKPRKKEEERHDPSPDA